MSRKRLPLAEENFARHSPRVLKALKTGEIDVAEYLILKVLIDEIAPPGSGGEVLHTLADLAKLLGWSHTDDWLRKKLHALREADWIDFDEPRRGPGAAWTFRLKRAAVDGEVADLQMNSKRVSDSEGGRQSETDSDSCLFRPRTTPLADRAVEAAEFQSGALPREEKRREGDERTRSEEKLDHARVETTATASDPAVTDRLLARVEALDRREPNSRRVVVDQADDGSLVWNGGPQEGESGTLADLQALVNAGLAEWRENDAEGEP